MRCIHGWAGFFSGLYGRRNAVFLSGFAERIGRLLQAVGQLQDACRREQTEKYGPCLASIVAWIFCVTDHFRQQLPLEELMVRKYPEKGCVYCGKKPCACKADRPGQIQFPVERQLVANENGQFHWTLERWCAHLRTVYGASNQQNGLENTFNRLFREACEILELLLVAPSSEATVQELEGAFAGELADTLAWTIAVANLLEVDLEKAMHERYDAGCPVCGGRTLCKCGRCVPTVPGEMRRIGVGKEKGKPL